MDDKDHFISRAQAEQMFAAYDKLSHDERQKLLMELPDGFMFPLEDVVKLTKDSVARQFMVRLGLKETDMQGATLQEITPVLYPTNKKGGTDEGSMGNNHAVEGEGFLDEGTRYP